MLRTKTKKEKETKIMKDKITFKSILIVQGKMTMRSRKMMSNLTTRYRK